MDEYLLNLIVILHFIFILFVVITPFVGNNYFLILHSIIVPFMMLHWYLNDNTCALTGMEMQLRKKIYNEEPNPHECFTFKLIAPVYDFNKNYSDFSIFLYIITLSLWFLSLYKLRKNYTDGKLSSIMDLVRY